MRDKGWGGWGIRGQGWGIRDKGWEGWEIRGTGWGIKDTGCGIRVGGDDE